MPIALTLTMCHVACASGTIFAHIANILLRSIQDSPQTNGGHQSRTRFPPLSLLSGNAKWHLVKKERWDPRMEPAIQTLKFILSDRHLLLHLRLLQPMIPISLGKYISYRTAKFCLRRPSRQRYPSQRCLNLCLFARLGSQNLPCQVLFHQELHTTTL